MGRKAETSKNVTVEDLEELTNGYPLTSTGKNEEKQSDL